ncbi:MAG: hypothetical protein J6X53_02045, partial [Abditibacteriota bacterium]|nr:hypothetical protein [Abditibacteriota bacterium]
ESEELGEPEELNEANEPEDPEESEEPENVEPVEERPRAEPTVKPESRGDSRVESSPGNCFHRDNPSPREGGKPSIRDQLHGYTPPARVAAPPDRKRPGVML